MKTDIDKDCFMKIRTSFVSNSSSSSFILGFEKEMKPTEQIVWLKSVVPSARLKKGSFWYDSSFLTEDFIKSTKDYRKSLEVLEQALKEERIPLNEEFINIFSNDDMKEVNKNNFEEYKNYIRTNIITKTYWSDYDRKRFNEKYLEPNFDQFFATVKEDIEDEIRVLKDIIKKMDKYGYNVAYELCLSDAGDGINVGILKSDGLIEDLRDIEDNLKLDFHKRILERWC